MNWDDEMQRALEADGEKLRQLTGQDHGPFPTVYDEPYPGYAPCPHCFESSGYAGQIISATWTDPSYEDADYSRPCWHCAGSGRVEAEPITLEDLDNWSET